MIIIFLISILLVIFIYWAFIKRSSIPKGLRRIPIEKGLPIIGVLHEIESPISVYYEKLIKKHGSIFGIRIGMREVLILNNYETIKKAFLDDGNNYSGRWKLLSSLFMSENSGVAFVDGNTWYTQRLFMLKVLHDFGVGKSISYEFVREECLHLMNELDYLNGTCVNVSNLIQIHIVNIISKFIMNKRFSRGDDKLTVFDNLITEIAKKKDLIQFLLFSLPVFDKIPWLCNWIIQFTYRAKLFHKVHQIIQEEVDEHKKLLDINSEGDDLIDRFLIKQHQLKSNTGLLESFTDFQLVRMSMELFIAGLETTMTTLEWSFLFMSKNLDIQQKVHDEIVDKIGVQRFPMMNDKKELHYTQAVMDEIFRRSSVAPLALIHRVINDCSLDGYYVPKNSLIYSNLYACHLDQNVWEKPNEFYPEHFLLKDSNGEIKYSPNENLNQFGIGKRHCAGESLARLEFFIFFTSIMQRFEVRFAEIVSDDLYKETIASNDGLIRSSMIKKFIFTKRE